MADVSKINVNNTDYNIKDENARNDINEINEELNKKINNYSNSNQVSLGNEELTDDSLWITDGWTGNRQSGFVHTIGQVLPLIYNKTFSANKTYLLEFDVESPSPSGAENSSNDFSVVIGNSAPFVTYRGGGSSHYIIGLKPKEDGDLRFICVNSVTLAEASGFDGTISNISLKEVVGTLEQIGIKDGNNVISNGFTITPSNKKNTYIGKETAQRNYNSDSNTYIGNSSGKNDITGFMNTAIGSETLLNLVNGSRNVAVGTNALGSNISGDRNIGIGTYAMTESKSTRRSIAIGYDSLYHNKTGDENIAIGGLAMQGAINSIGNIAIGHRTLALYNTENLGTNNIAIGGYSQAYNNSGAGNIGIGAFSVYKNKTGNNNIAIGSSALYGGEENSNVIAIGFSAGNQLDNSDFSVLIGGNSLQSLTEISQSVAIGYLSGSTITKLTNSIVLGRRISGTTGKTEFTNVIAIGTQQGLELSRDNWINICNIINANIVDVPNKPRIGICGQSDPSAKLHIGAQNENSGTAPLKFTSGQLMTTPEQGAIEYDGTNLYITFTNGIRKKISVEDV